MNGKDAIEIQSAQKTTEMNTKRDNTSDIAVAIPQLPRNDSPILAQLRLLLQLVETPGTSSILLELAGSRRRNRF